MKPTRSPSRILLPCLFAWVMAAAPAAAGEIVGVTVTPHVIAEGMEYRRPRDPGLGAKVQLFVAGPALPGTFAGREPGTLVESGEWAWHDLATARESPAGSLTVWTFNAPSNRWGVGTEFVVEGEGLDPSPVAIRTPSRWISAITFLSSGGEVAPDTVVVHVVNDSDAALRVESLRWWIPRDRSEWQVLWPRPPDPVEVVVPPRDRGFVKLQYERPLPPGYAALELMTDVGPLWEHLRVKREVFDIGGGWVADNLPHEHYLKLLTGLHVTMGQIEAVPGYTDRPELFDRYPIKLCNRLWPLERWDTDEWLPRIHAVEFLGEPQYGGGRPVPPQEVFDKLLPYRSGRLATSVTHSEERVWRSYAGLSDFPHYDAYRVVAPAADAWRQYDRWGGERIGWGAPLETIGAMSRSLRELNRPMPCAFWSQGPHDGWEGGLRIGGVQIAGRARRSPTPDELRAQALHALSTRITSLYWFNLGLPALRAFPDTLEPMRRVGREIRMLEPFFLEGDAYRYERVMNAGAPDWDLASVAAPDAAVLFANDLAYRPDGASQTFVFPPDRPVSFRFVVPSWLRPVEDLFRVDADGVHDVQWGEDGDAVVIDDRRSRDAIYVATRSRQIRDGVESRRRSALAREEANVVGERDLDRLAE